MIIDEMHRDTSFSPYLIYNINDGRTTTTERTHPHKIQRKEALLWLPKIIYHISFHRGIKMYVDVDPWAEWDSSLYVVCCRSNLTKGIIIYRFVRHKCVAQKIYIFLNVFI